MHNTINVKIYENAPTVIRGGTYPFGKGLSTVVNLVPVFCFLLGAALAVHPIIILDSGTLLSVGALSAEISFTFYGLLFAGYTFYSETLSNLASGDESYVDIILNMQVGYKNWLRALGLQCILAVSCNVGVCLLSSNNLLLGFFYSVLINAACLMSISLMVECIVFVVRMVNPESIIRTASEMMGSYTKEGASETIPGCTIEGYLRKYNVFEKFLLWRSDLSIDYSRGRMTTMFDAIKRLYEIGAINRNEADALHEVRKYRNLLVHDNDAALEPEQMIKLDEQYRYYTEEKFADAFMSYCKDQPEQRSRISQ